MKTQYRIINKGKGVMNITPANLNKVEQPVVFSGDYNDLTNKPAIRSVQNEYATIPLLKSGQADQTAGAFQAVVDASGDPTVTSGYAYYEYLGVANGLMGDYRKLSEQESMDLVPITAVSQLINDRLKEFVAQPNISKTIALTDLNKAIKNTNANPTTITIPTNAAIPLPIGFECDVISEGIGVVTIVASGLNVISDLASMVMAIGETRTLLKTDTDTWSIKGKDKVSFIEITDNLYVDAQNGNDLTGIKGRKDKAFKTIDVALSQANTYSYTIIELLSDGVYFINQAYNNLTSLEIKSERLVVVSFANNPNGMLTGNYVNGTNLKILIPNGDLEFSSTVNQFLNRGTLKIDCRILSTGYNGGGAGVLINEMYPATITAQKMILTRGLYYCGNAENTTSVITCPNVVVNAANVKISSCNNTTTCRIFVYLLGNVSGTGNLILISNSGETHVGNINTIGNTVISSNVNNNAKIVFYNSVISGTQIIPSVWSMDKVTLSGTINPSSCGIGGGHMAGGKLIFRDFSHDFKNQSLLLKYASFVIYNSDLKFDGVPFTRENGTTPQFEIYGNNSIYSRNPTVMFGGNTTAVATINNYGKIQSNIPSLGTNVTNNTINTQSY